MSSQGWLPKKSQAKINNITIWATLDELLNLKRVPSNTFTALQVSVVYFDQLLSAARTQKLVELLFFSCFQPYLFISNLFQWFHAWKHKKTCSCLLLKAGWQSKAGRLPERVPQNFRLIFFTFLKFFVSFWLILVFFINLWKRLKKSSSTRFWVRAAPKSWLKYTTSNYIYFPFLS